MKVSVAIPAYNCAATIRETLDSVLRQTVQAYEVLVVDDGSTDDTLYILNSYEDRITVISQRNQGPGVARDALCARAKGDLVAFLDSDDIWHPRYLEVQTSLCETIPQAAAYFTGHVNFTGDGSYQWESDPCEKDTKVQIMSPAQFLKRYNKAPGAFTPSRVCVSKRVLVALGSRPFRWRMAEDAYFFNLTASFGPIAFLDKPMVAYRVREGSHSYDHLKMAQADVQVFEFLAERYEALTDARLRRVFADSFAAKRRFYAKVLLGVGRTRQARDQLRRSLENKNPLSLAKSVRLLLLSYLPTVLQPTWPGAHREWKGAQDS